MLVLVVDAAGELPEAFKVVGANRFLQLGHRQRIKQMVFPIAPPFVDPADVELQAFRYFTCGKRVLVARFDFPDDSVESDTAYARRGSGEIVVDHVAVNPDGLADLRTAIGMQCGDTHLGHDLEHALVDGFDVVARRFAHVGVGQGFLPDHVFEVFENHVGVDRSRTKAEKQAKVVYFARLTAFNHQAAAGALHLLDQVVVYRRRRQ